MTRVARRAARAASEAEANHAEQSAQLRARVEELEAAVQEEGWEASEEQGDIEVEWEDGRAFHQGQAVRPRDEAETLWVTNTSDRPQRVPVYFLVHGKVGSTAALVLHDLSRATPGISPSSLRSEPVTIEQGAEVAQHGGKADHPRRE